MIKAHISINGNKCRLNVKGHSGYNPGNDIVCSACSALVGALSGYVCHRAEFEVEKIKEEVGCAEIEASGGCIEDLFGMVLIGLLRIAKAYPDNISVTYDLDEKAEDY